MPSEEHAADDDDDSPIAYGDLRMSSDRRNGPCLFWVRRDASAAHSLCPCTPVLSDSRALQVVPDVSKGFNVPAFYAQFLAEPEGPSQGRG